MDIGSGAAARAEFLNDNGFGSAQTGGEMLTVNGNRNGHRNSGVHSEAPREKGNWDNLFMEVKKASLRSETWDQGKAPRHQRSGSNVTV